MSENQPLSDDEVFERLHAVLLELVNANGATVRGDTALKAARQALALLQMSLLKAQDQASDELAAIKDQTLP